VSFLERLEELQREYGYDGALLLRGLPEMLRGDALLWYRNNRATGVTWEDFFDDFRDYYLPRRYYAQLRRDIQACCTDRSINAWVTDFRDHVSFLVIFTFMTECRAQNIYYIRS
jgi:hypothetical protein